MKYGLTIHIIQQLLYEHLLSSVDFRVNCGFDVGHTVGEYHNSMLRLSNHDNSLCFILIDTNNGVESKLHEFSGDLLIPVYPHPRNADASYFWRITGISFATSTRFPSGICTSSSDIRSRSHGALPANGITVLLWPEFRLVRFPKW